MSKTRENNALVTVDATLNDPDYEIFWSNVKKCGTSYILQSDENNRLHAPVIYEREDGLGDDLYLDFEENTKTHETEADFSDKVPHFSFDPIPSSNAWCSSGGLDIRMGSRKKWQRNRLRRTSNAVKRTNVGSAAKCSMDEDYAVFCNGLRRNGFHQIFDISPSLMVVYEAECEEKFKKDYGLYIRAGSGKVSKRRLLGCTSNLVKKTSAKAAETYSVDENYAVICNTLKMDAFSPICEVPPGTLVVYESENEEKCRTDNRLSHQKAHTEFLYPEESDDVVIVAEVNHHNSRREMRSAFRRDVIEEIRKPYNERELRILYRNIKARKPVLHNMDLAHGSVLFYSGDREGKSYLDHHTGLKRKLSATKDNYKRLNLLRGFFFWLQNVERDGTFQPWEDGACLAVLPRDC